MSWSYAFVRRFHAPSAGVLVVTQSIRDELAARGFKNLVPWSRGVDITAFKPRRSGRAPSDRAADLALCRPRRDREEHRGLPRARPARHQVGGRRRPAARRAQAPLSRTPTSSARSAPRSWRALCPGRLLRLPQPHRHVRPGHARGAGLAACRSRAIRCRARSTSSPCPSRRARRGSPRRLPRRRHRRSRGLPRHAESFTWARCAAAVPLHPAPDPAQRLAAAQAPRRAGRGCVLKRTPGGQGRCMSARPMRMTVPWRMSSHSLKPAARTR